jgi:hypothetical protein
MAREVRVSTEKTSYPVSACLEVIPGLVRRRNVRKMDYSRFGHLYGGLSDRHFENPRYLVAVW